MNGDPTQVLDTRRTLGRRTIKNNRQLNALAADGFERLSTDIATAPLGTR